MNILITQFIAWYLIVQLITLLTLPLSTSLFVNVPDRGYALAKILGILLVGFTLWLGTSYGLLRNETGGAWLALVIVGAASLFLGRTWVSTLLHTRKLNLPWQPVVAVEVLFLLAFAGWALVRAYDPAANHTEQPMDLMFMNSIWVSPTYPPHDAWLSGYAISYYYFGYWLLTTLGRLAGQPPEIAYNLGQACWFGLLLIGCFGVVYNLLAHAGRRQRIALLGGLLAAVAIGLTGNLLGVFEWLYAGGVDVSGLMKFFNVAGFPQTPPLGDGWTATIDWWRSSRVIEDTTLLGDHLEVIDEFPFFSYLLGDNHPHVTAMPVVLLVISLAQNLFFGRFPAPTPSVKRLDEDAPVPEQGLAQALGQLLQLVVPLSLPGLVVTMIAAGALVFLNTWDFPPYWLLLIVAFGAVSLRAIHLTPGLKRIGRWGVGLAAASFGLLILGGTIALYLPYFLTAQSQAGGFLPNLFNPTRLPQFFLMFGYGMLGVGALVALAWSTWQPSRQLIINSLAVVYGLPLLFLLVSIGLALATTQGQELLARMPLPEGATSHLGFIVMRWLRQGFTFLVVGALLAFCLAWLWSYFGHQLRDGRYLPTSAEQSQTFAILLATLGLLLVFAPEFVYLRDNFGTRMNTVFKFYYQGWLLFGLCSSYAIMTVVPGLFGKGLWPKGPRVQRIATVCGILSLLGIGLGLFYTIPALITKTDRFRMATPTLDATAYIAVGSPNEMAAVDWVRTNTAPDALVVEGKGASYDAGRNRISTLTGRPTLLGWDGHESQWRGKAYGTMAQGRPEVLELIYSRGSTDEVIQALAQWQIDYVYVGPTERGQYGMTPLAEERLTAAMDLVFEQGDVRIYRRRSQ